MNAFDLYFGASSAEGDAYSAGVSTDDDGSFSLQFGKDAGDGEALPATSDATATDTDGDTLLDKVKPYAAPVGIALALVLLALAMSKGGGK